jgi:hypothetical protein
MIFSGMWLLEETTNDASRESYLKRSNFTVPLMAQR